MRKHQNATESAKSVSTLDKDVWAEAIKQWATGNALGEKNGWRNAQASVLAPTGTIGLMMDCDTTSISVSRKWHSLINDLHRTTTDHLLKLNER